MLFEAESRAFEGGGQPVQSIKFPGPIHTRNRYIEVLAPASPFTLVSGHEIIVDWS